MFSRLKDAFERSMAEEQARLKALTENKASTSAATTTTTTGEPDGPSSTAQAGNGQNGQGQAAPVNPDPAVFEAAFKQADDFDPLSRSGTPIPTAPTADKNTPAQQENDGPAKAAGTGASEAPRDSAAPAPPASAPPDLPPHVKSKLKKLERIEPMYQELLRSYRIAHSQISPFERALRENTPLNSIKDPGALIEYLNQLKLRSDMAVQEVNRVSAEKDDMVKRFAQIEKESAILKDEISALKTIKVDEAASRRKAEEAKEAEETEKAEKADEGQDMFSYDDEIPKLQAELISKDEKIASLTSEIDTLKSGSGTTTLSTADNPMSGPVAVVVGAEHDFLRVSLKELKEQLLKAKSSLEGDRSSGRSTQGKQNTEVYGQSLLADLGLLISAALLGYQKAIWANKDGVENLAHEALSDSKASDILAASELPFPIFKTTEPTEATEADEATEATLDTIPSPSITPLPGASSVTSTTASTKKKNKGKKKKGNATRSPSRYPSGTPNPPPYSLEQPPHIQALETEISKLKDVITEKDLRISKLSERVGHKEVLLEEIDELRDTIVTVGQDHVEAKDRIKELERDRQSLQSRVSQLEEEVASFAGISEAKAKLEADHETLKKEHEELNKDRTRLESEVLVEKKLASDRFEKLTQEKNNVANAKAELTRLRKTSDQLKQVQADAKAVKQDLEASAKHAKELQHKLDRSDQLRSEQEDKIKLLNEQLTTEKASVTKHKGQNQVLVRGYQRAEKEKDEEATKAKELSLELGKSQSELSSLRPKVKELEDEVTKLQKELNSAQALLDLKTQQVNAAQGLITSMNDQQAESVTQKKEMEAQINSLREETIEVRKHLDDRTREAETMRRMLAEANEQADVKVRDMRSQLEKAIEERDQIEAESSNLARSRARELEGLRNRARELEHEVKTLADEKYKVEAREKEWIRRREELEPNERKAAAEIEDLRSAVSSLRTALDASEQQVLDVEKQKADLRRLLDEARDRYEKANKELKSVQSRLHVGSGPDVTSSGKDTVDSARNSFAGSQTKTKGLAADANYLRGIFLQFLECKEEKVRAQLIPVLGKLLGFNKNDEQRWLKACQHLQKPNR